MVNNLRLLIVLKKVPYLSQKYCFLAFPILFLLPPFPLSFQDIQCNFLTSCVTQHSFERFYDSLLCFLTYAEYGILIFFKVLFNASFQLFLQGFLSGKIR